MSRQRPGTDAPAYHEMMARLVRRYGVRAGADTGSLAMLAEVGRQVDEALAVAVAAHRAGGASWDEIARALTAPGKVPDRTNTRRKYSQ